MLIDAHRCSSGSNSGADLTLRQTGERKMDAHGTKLAEPAPCGLHLQPSHAITTTARRRSRAQHRGLALDRAAFMHSVANSGTTITLAALLGPSSR